MMVVDMVWPIQTDAHSEIVLLEKVHQLLVDECAVGLNAVGDDGPATVVLALKINGLLEEIDSRQQRFATVPKELAPRFVDLQQLPGHPLKDRFRHDARRLHTLVHVAIEAVVALQIARHVGAFDDRKNPHCSILVLKGAFQNETTRPDLIKIISYL